jgi:hypothetical protein
MSDQKTMEGEAVEEIYALAYRLLDQEKKTLAETRRELMGLGLEPEDAAKVVDYVFLDLKERNRNMRTHLLLGVVGFFGGLLIGGMAYMVGGIRIPFIGAAIILGAIELVVGLRLYARNWR